MISQLFFLLLGNLGLGLGLPDVLKYLGCCDNNEAEITCIQIHLSLSLLVSYTTHHNTISTPLNNMNTEASLYNQHRPRVFTFWRGLARRTNTYKMRVMGKKPIKLFVYLLLVTTITTH